jgi:hypothetical protein
MAGTSTVLMANNFPKKTFLLDMRIDSLNCLSVSDKPKVSVYFGRDPSSPPTVKLVALPPASPAPSAIRPPPAAEVAPLPPRRHPP